jgi:diacylglycerol O-acyltransferase-1
MFYFLSAPTLCFQLEYPRSPSVRWRFVLRRLVELLFCLALMVFFSEQYIAPAVQNTLVYMDTMKFVHLFERVLKLAVPSLFVWLLMFYALFHAYLNLLAELLRFGDRLFYKAWWNASTLEEYWKLWNVPVHSWCVKHLYAPLLRAGATPTMAMFCVFLFSAVMHEVLISIPCHTWYWYGFVAMFGQIPIILLQKVVHRYLPQGSNDWVGNISFWLTFCIFGQPIVMLLYMHQFAKASSIATL